MRATKSDPSAELTHQPRGTYLEHRDCETVSKIYQTIHRSGLEKFTVSFIDTLFNDLRTVIYDLDRLPHVVYKEMIEVLMGLNEARNELRSALFLFHVEEIDPVYRLVLRNKAVLRGKDVLRRVLISWPLYNSTHE